MDESFFEAPKPGSHEQFGEEVKRQLTVEDAKKLYEVEEDYWKKRFAFEEKQSRTDIDPKTGEWSVDTSVRPGQPERPEFMPIGAIIDLKKLVWRRLDYEKEKLEEVGSRLGEYANALYALGKENHPIISKDTGHDEIGDAIEEEMGMTLGELHTLIVKAHRMLLANLEENYSGWENRLLEVLDTIKAAENNPDEIVDDAQLREIFFEGVSALDTSQNNTPTPFETAKVLTEINKTLGLLDLPPVTAEKDRLSEN
jgi:hypothetical protein